jgi:hypothetical protein
LASRGVDLTGRGGLGRAPEVSNAPAHAAETSRQPPADRCEQRPATLCGGRLRRLQGRRGGDRCEGALANLIAASRVRLVIPV